MQAMVLQAEESAQGKANMIALGNRRAMLSVFDTAELFERAMILFDMPQTGDVIGQRVKRHGQVIGGPVFTAAVWGSYLEDLNPAIAFEMHHATPVSYTHLTLPTSDLV